jgi:hypothetical protein
MPFVSCSAFNTSQAAQDLAIAAAAAPQDISIASNNLSISGGSTVAIPQQTLSVASNNLSISDGNTVAIPQQTLSILGNALTVSDGNTVTLPIPTTLPPSGAASGVLSGTYPAPAFVDAAVVTSALTGTVPIYANDGITILFRAFPA